MNRRCVAQSRARCGVYFIGNANMFINNKTWRYLIQNLKNDRRLSDNISLLCKRHPEIPCPIKNSDALTLESFCMVDCGLKMHCGKHPCLKKCQPPHNHRPCKEKVAFVHLTCGHKDTRFCEEDERNKKCKASVPFRFPKCGHLGEKKCFEDINSISCTQMEIVDLKCGHRKMKMCFQNIDDVKCEEICMQKLNPCGHLCSGHKCFEHASQKTCMTCKKQQEAELALQRKKEKQAREEYDAKIDIQIKRLQKEARLEKGVEYIPLFPQNETHAEYLEVEDLVKKYVQPGHNWYPTIKEISKVVNREMRIRFLKCSTMLFDSEPRVTYKFHGTDDKGVDGITKNGFRLPSTPGMYGAGIYLATDSSKSAQTIYTKGSNKLIVCEVYLGKSYVVKHAEDTLNAGKLKALKFDSVFAPRDTKGTGGVLFDEFVVFNIDQVFPKYIIHYTKHQFSVNKIPLNVSFKSTTFAQGKKTMKSKRQVDMSDPLEAHFAFVESRFLRMLNRKGVKHEITDIDVYMNPQLEAKFDAKVAEFKQKYPRSSDSEPIYGFHGTKSSQVVDSIMDNNFNRSNQGKFGAGVYFSEQPSYTFNYGGQNHLIMARILPGKTRECQNGWSSGGCTPGYDSHAGFKQPDGTFDEVVIFNTEQILPCYVIHFK